MTTITGTHWVEIALEYEGTDVPYRPATRTDPEEGGNVEDIGVEGLSADVVTRKLVDGTVVRRTSTANLLDGCDLTSPDIKRLLMNLTEAFRDTLQDAANDGLGR